MHGKLEIGQMYVKALKHTQKRRLASLSAAKSKNEGRHATAISPDPKGRTLKRVLHKIVFRLRSGYAGVGFFTHMNNAVLPCPRCGGHDSIRHMLLDCSMNHEQRTLLFERVAATTKGRHGITLPLLLGFHKSLSSRELRQITTATGQFVLDIGRHV